MKVVAHVSIEQGDSIFSVSHIGAASRARRCRRRAGHRGERMAAIGKSPVKGFWKGRDRGER